MLLSRSIPFASIWRPFPVYLIVQASWFAGFGLQTALFPFLSANVLHVSPELLSIAQMTLTAPAVILIFFGGVIAERADRRALLIILHFLALVPPLVLAALIFQDKLSYLALICFGLAMGSISAIVMPTRDAALNAVAKYSKGLSVQRAVVWASVAQFGAQILGMGLAAAAANTLGPGVLIVVEAIIIGIGGLAALALPRLKNGNETTATASPEGALQIATTILPPQTSTWAQIREGIDAVRNSPIIRSMTVLMMGVGVFVLGSFFVLLPVLVRDEYHGGLRELSLLYLAFWSGALIGVTMLATFGHVHQPGRALLLSLLGSVAALFSMAMAIPFWAFLIVMVLWGIAAGVIISMSRSIVQDSAPADKLARVLSIFQFGFLGGAPIGTLAIGFIIGALGPRTAALVPMTGLLITVLWLALFTPIVSFTHEEAKKPDD